MIIANKEISIGSPVVMKQQGVSGYFVASRGEVKNLYYIDPITKNFEVAVILWSDGAESKIMAHKIIIENVPEISAARFDALRNIFL